jgi:anthranilate phosphoribosyltransferase
VLAELGTENGLVVHGADGLDEISPTGPTRTWQVRRGSMVEGTIDPAELGLPHVEIAQIASGDPPANAATARSILAGEQGARRETVLLNAGAALMVAGNAGDLREGMALAARSIDSGAAQATLERWAAASQRLAAEAADASAAGAKS